MKKLDISRVSGVFEVQKGEQFKFAGMHFLGLKTLFEFVIAISLHPIISVANMGGKSAVKPLMMMTVWLVICAEVVRGHLPTMWQKPSVG